MLDAFLGVKFSSRVLLRVKELTFRNSGSIIAEQANLLTYHCGAIDGYQMLVLGVKSCDQSIVVRGQVVRKSFKQ